ncbi:hypothetical protein L3X38_003857 [Prunus dulcis]|uniref:Uncharacterized protein n=1 Tax=Prunus dulcis TaxID=3755 RepID=A0AAD4ZMX5_PRUDU|nr:hypothetical protein L3X38_003857 [Prunus dulcis]
MLEEKVTPTFTLLEGTKVASINTNNGGTIVHECPNAPWSSDLQIPSLHKLMTAPSPEIWEDSLADQSAEGRKIFVKRAKRMAKHFPPNHRSTTHPGEVPPSSSKAKNPKPDTDKMKESSQSHVVKDECRQLSPSMLTIQGFNQLGQKSMGSVALEMEIRDLYLDALFQVIDADTSYNVLLDGHGSIHMA